MVQNKWLFTIATVIWVTSMSADEESLSKVSLSGFQLNANKTN